MRSRRLALAVVLGLLPVSGWAQYRSFITRDAGPYFRYDVGPAIAEPGRVLAFSPFGGAGGKVDYDVGVMMNSALGFAFNPNVAAELEFGWLWNDLDRVEGFSVGRTEFYNFPIMGNVLLQYPIPQTLLVPYIGAGAGGSVTYFNADGFSNGQVTLVGEDTDFVFAWHAKAGLRLELNERFHVGLGYKYLHTEDSSYRYPSLNFGQPDLRLGWQGVRAHVVTLSVTAKF